MGKGCRAAGECGRLYKGSQVQIMISDNGAGFSETVLEDLTEDRSIRQNQRECVGIRNVIARLQLFYGEQAKVECFNQEGAVVKIRVPM